MRTPAVLLNVVFACAVGGFLGYTIAVKVKQEEINHLQGERERMQTRERELRSQLEESLNTRQALEQESQRLQDDLNERLRRLEELAAQLHSHDEHRERNTIEDDATQEDTDDNLLRQE
ncbi:MAG: hypothetical protein AB7G75_02015 [Candidatus Binatia bacterium]